MSSLCDRCYAPGNCCKRLWISRGEKMEPVTTWTDEGEAGALASMALTNLPFVPLEVAQVFKAEDGREYQTWIWGCPKLQANGRCGIYEDRPKLCRSYEPREDELCVHHTPAEAGDPTVMAV